MSRVVGGIITVDYILLVMVGNRIGFERKRLIDNPRNSPRRRAACYNNSKLSEQFVLWS